jgi:uncharacterized protein (DUF433 family)
VTRTNYAQTVGTVTQMPPRGHYLAWEAGQLAGVSGQKIGQWSRRGYIRASQDDRGFPKVYSFQDVAEAMVVHELEDAGADLKSIKLTIKRLRERHGMAWPLQHYSSRLGTVHGNVVEHDGDGLAVDLGGTGSPEQAVLTDENLRKIAGQLERGGWAVRKLTDLRHVEVDPDRLSGRPAIRGRRIAASEVAEISEEPDGIETLVEGYGLDEAEIDDARRWWGEVRALAA